MIPRKREEILKEIESLEDAINDSEGLSIITVLYEKFNVQQALLNPESLLAEAVELLEGVLLNISWRPSIEQVGLDCKIKRHLKKVEDA